MLVRRMQAWLVAAHLPEMVYRDKPMLVLVGPPGSGKTTLLKLLLRLLYGPRAMEYIPTMYDDRIVDVTYERPEYYIRLSPIIAAELSGAVFGPLGHDLAPAISLARETAGWEGAWMVTACLPSHPILYHPEISDRLLVLPLASIPPAARISEGTLMRQADVYHHALWEEIITLAGAVASAMYDGEIMPTPDLTFLALDEIAKYLCKQYSLD